MGESQNAIDAGGVEPLEFNNPIPQHILAARFLVSGYDCGGSMRNMVTGCAAAALLALSAGSEAPIPAHFELMKSMRVAPALVSEVGLASWYGSEIAGTTANGEEFDASQLTAAHRTLPLNSKIKVTNLRNGRAVILRVNDRGPNITGRLLDVSLAAAQRLGFTSSGKARVRVTVVGYPKGYVTEPDSSFVLLPSCATQGFD
jgi:rare lipoprotein A (peptidoglycan hydrolase)